MSEAITRYSTAFRDLVNDKNLGSAQDIKTALRLNKESDWRFVCAAMDVLQDSQQAIDNFLKWGLDGPTRYNDIGEKYLRLYGLLSATYLQQNSVLELYRLMNVPDPDAARDKLSALRIRDLRNKLASHSTNHVNPATGEVEAFAPVQITLRGHSCQIASLTLAAPEDVDFDASLNEHVALILELLDEIYAKTFKTLFKGQNRRLDECAKNLEDLRVYKRGGQIVDLGGQRIIINAVARSL